jgi:hypothetical protein
MEDKLLQLLFLLARYLHIVCGSLLVGGTLFYELVVPAAIQDLREPAQLAVFARARWAFRWIVLSCAIVLFISGIIGSYRSWDAYRRQEARLHVLSSHPAAAQSASERLSLSRTWWAAHLALGTISLAVAVSLVVGQRPPRYPVQWMRINLILLLTAVFLATTARHLRLMTTERFSIERHNFPEQ